MKIVLDAAEEKIRSLLLRFAHEFAAAGNAEVTLRFTGGWVRDKLLGRASHDIDVAIDKSTGDVFATALRDYLVASGDDEDAGGVHKIASNPEKSKHLETATMRICGLDIDFVNLRSEEYADQSSRVPTSIKFGTPQEDAMRRDATLNALFYNLSTDAVEDFTGRGLTDLRSGVLRTPLDPAVTFSDDPLRVLRLIRFAGQLGFSIAPETLEAMHGNKMGPLLQQKVSGERVGTEIEKLVEAPQAICGLRYLAQLGLGPHVFVLPASASNAPLAPSDDLAARVDAANAIVPDKLAPGIRPQTPNQRAVLWLAIILQPWRGIAVPTGKKNKTEDAVGLIVKEGLKLTRAAKEGVAKLHSSANAVDAFLSTQAAGKQIKRHALGNFVRAAGPLWPLCLAYNSTRLDAPDDMNKIAQLIAGADLAEAYNLKPLLDGRQVTKLLDREPGLWLQSVTAALIEYQLDNPQATLEDTEEFVRSIGGER